MADTWGDYLWGSGEQRLADLERQRQQFDAAKASPQFQALRRLAHTGADVDFDPRQALLDVPTPDGGMVRDTLHPSRTSDAAADEYAAIRYVTEMGSRPRDTLIRAAQEATAGNAGNALSLVARAPAATLYPPAAAGIPGAPDDWREHARRQGVPEASITAIDFGTDPEMWLTAPVSGPAAFVLPAIPFAAARAAGRMGSRADDVLRAIGRQADQLRYGAGAKTDLIDSSGEVIRRLRNSPEYARP